MGALAAKGGECTAGKESRAAADVEAQVEVSDGWYGVRATLGPPAHHPAALRPDAHWCSILISLRPCPLQTEPMRMEAFKSPGG